MHSDDPARNARRTPTRRIVVLGSTGSVGVQALDVITRLNARSAVADEPPAWDVVGLAAGSGAEVLLEQAARFGVRDVALAAGAALLQTPRGARVRTGPGAAEDLVRETNADLVVGAIVGMAGLAPVLAALEQGTDVALANKESLVAAGAVVTGAAQRTGARILPIDSEHAGVWRCLIGAADTKDAAVRWAPPIAPGVLHKAGVERVTLTASGGAFRGESCDKVRDATPEETLRHPTWRMGAKVTVDSATMLNKALEIIEAHWLFGLGADRLDAVVHPESVVHAVVRSADGSSVAHLAEPDMRGPIDQALAWPVSAPAGVAGNDLLARGSLSFEPLGPRGEQALAIAKAVIDSGGTAGAVLNGANEAAVAAFLAGQTPFGAVVGHVQAALDAAPSRACGSLQSVQEADAWARRFVQDAVQAASNTSRMGR